MIKIRDCCQRAVGKQVHRISPKADETLKVFCMSSTRPANKKLWFEMLRRNRHKICLQFLACTFILLVCNHLTRRQRAKKVMSDSPGLVDFAIGLVFLVLNLPSGQVLFFGGNSNYRRIVINPANQKGFWGQLK